MAVDAAVTMSPVGRLHAARPRSAGGLGRTHGRTERVQTAPRQPPQRDWRNGRDRAPTPARTGARRSGQQRQRLSAKNCPPRQSLPPAMPVNASSSISPTTMTTNQPIARYRPVDRANDQPLLAMNCLNSAMPPGQVAINTDHAARPAQRRSNSVPAIGRYSDRQWSRARWRFCQVISSAYYGRAATNCTGGSVFRAGGDSIALRRAAAVSGSGRRPAAPRPWPVAVGISSPRNTGDIGRGDMVC